jgi:hypothetical protein
MLVLPPFPVISSLNFHYIKIAVAWISLIFGPKKIEILGKKFYIHPLPNFRVRVDVQVTATLDNCVRTLLLVSSWIQGLVGWSDQV